MISRPTVRQPISDLVADREY